MRGSDARPRPALSVDLEPIEAGFVNSAGAPKREKLSSWEKNDIVGLTEDL